MASVRFESEEIVIYGPMKFVAKGKLLFIIAVLKQKNLQSQKLNRFCKNFV
ncbi:Uncharacterised protein [Streptococcus cristatus ATCC 51100]|nr:hypothetical protein TZ85_00658 [Streptococcus cristatus]SQG33080.1 Uncharacterised protein [Streptococcus cristatus ATCC 51100]